MYHWNVCSSHVFSLRSASQSNVCGLCELPSKVKDVALQPETSLYHWDEVAVQFSSQDAATVAIANHVLGTFMHDLENRRNERGSVLIQATSSSPWLTMTAFPDSRTRSC